MIKAANKFYVIEGIGQKKETSGGIIIQRSDETELARILSVGPDIEKPYDIGTEIVINWQHVVAITLKGKRVFILHCDSIFATVDPEESTQNV